MGGAGSNTGVDERSEALLASLAQSVAGGDRRSRQTSAHAIAEISRSNPEAVVAYVDAIVAAAGMPEAQTRWEAFDALTAVAPVDPDAAAKGFDCAEASLFDEESGLVRTMAFKYLVGMGSCGAQWSRRVWPLVDEALQCYHGDPEFGEMLDAVAKFATSELDPEVARALARRVTFDAKNARGHVAAKSKEILDAIG